MFTFMRRVFLKESFAGSKISSTKVSRSGLRLQLVSDNPGVSSKLFQKQESGIFLKSTKIPWIILYCHRGRGGGWGVSNKILHERVEICLKMTNNWQQSWLCGKQARKPWSYTSWHWENDLVDPFAVLPDPRMLYIFWLFLEVSWLG